MLRSGTQIGPKLRMHAQTDGQPENNAPGPMYRTGGCIKRYATGLPLAR